MLLCFIQRKKIISKTYSAGLRSLNNTLGTQTMAIRVSSMDHQIKLYFNANLHVYMKLWLEMSTVSFDVLVSVNNKWICFLIAGLLTFFYKKYLSSLRTHREKMYKSLIYFQVYKEQSTCFRINEF